MKETKVILQTEGKLFEEALNKRLNEGYVIKASNSFTTKDPFKPYAFYALLEKE